MKPDTNTDSIQMSPRLRAMADEIIKAEKGDHSWTLMHRFNLCHDFLERVETRDDLALLFVWLRFSAMRQLDWQRNYNTKPRELSHAQQRLTTGLASLYPDHPPEDREIIRLIFSTLGRGAEGGKGQRIRDDILHIMHRHKVKEVSGHFLEEWHQKLHNNTTPDDIVICEAYLAFLRHNGDLDAFHQILEQGGVTRERLRSFERPIVSDPQFVPHIKEGLIHDFENYLGLLRSIHSATDLASAIAGAGHCLEEGIAHKAGRLYGTRDDPGISLLERVGTVTELRTELKKTLNRAESSECIRDILYLDLALEEFLRVIVERNTHKDLAPDLIEDLIALLVENVGLHHPDPELGICLDLLHNLKKQETIPPKDRALHLIAVNERLSNVLASFADYYTALLQGKAEYLGRGFGAEQWVIGLFSQEIIRAGSAFVLSILLGLIEPDLRRKAGLGSWQVISRAEAAGRLRVDNLTALQDSRLSEPTVLVSDRISGDEEITDNLTGVITPSGVDVLSHVAVRARNAGILFACSHDRKSIDPLKKLEGRQVALSVTSSGEVTCTEEAPASGPAQGPSPAAGSGPAGGHEDFREVAVPSLRYKEAGDESPLAVGMDAFVPELVGGKGHQLQRLRRSLPDWIKVPASVAVPFGVCEKVLALPANAAAKEEHDRLLQEVERDPAGVLPEIRSLFLELILPDALMDDLGKALKQEGIPAPEDPETVETRIKQVWASKWNDRAYYSRQKWRISHQDLVMSVLIQETVPAEYAFVLHTVNPFSGKRDELYGEIVVGMGETLCSGSYQGRALSFVCPKSEKARPSLQHYPSKGEALFGGGLIFRSDSNGEDLKDYAGAGLYDSFTLEPPRVENIDYTKVDLLWHEEHRDNFFRKLAGIGLEVEKAMQGEAQDIEGAYAGGEFYVVQTRPQVGLKAGEPPARPSREEAEPPLHKQPVRIGNQTSYAAARYSDPFDFAVKHGFNAFEWFPDKKEDGSGWNIDEISNSRIEAIRNTAAEHDILLSVHAPWWANPLDEEGNPLLRRHVDFARDLGAKLLNLHFQPDRGPDVFLERLEPLILACHEAGIRLAVENTPETGPDACNTFFTLLSRKNIPAGHVGLCFDLGHANLCQTTRNDYVGYLQALQPHVPIIHAHFHENFGDRDSHLPLFTGPSKDDPRGLELVMELLRKREFDGAVILEQWPRPPSLLIEARNRLLDLSPVPENTTRPPEPDRKTGPVKKKR